MKARNSYHWFFWTEASQSRKGCNRVMQIIHVSGRTLRSTGFSRGDGLVPVQRHVTVLQFHCNHACIASDCDQHWQVQHKQQRCCKRAFNQLESVPIPSYVLSFLPMPFHKIPAFEPLVKYKTRLQQQVAT